MVHVMLRSHCKSAMHFEELGMLSSVLAFLMEAKFLTLKGRDTEISVAGKAF